MLSQLLSKEKIISSKVNHLLHAVRNSSTQSSLQPNRRKIFPVLANMVEEKCPQITAGNDVTQENLAMLAKLNEICVNGGGPKAQEKFKTKKVLPREKIRQLWDDPEEDTLEFAQLAGLSMPYGDIPSAGMITTIGKIHGRYCLVSANDGTFKGGSYFPIGVKKQLSAALLADKCGLPLVLFVDSGGGFLPLQSDFFPDKMHGGRMFYLEAEVGGRGLPSVAVVCGSCTAGGAYGPSMCEEAAMVDKIGTLFLGGPPLVKAALGEEISAEELGGATLHTKVSGVMDYFMETEEESFSLIRDSIATTNYSKETEPPYEPEKPLYSSSILDGLAGKESLDKDAMYSIISRLVDGSRFGEFKGTYGQNLIVGYSFINGHCVGVVANHGPLTCADGVKGAHFLQICEHRKLPVIFLQNSGASDPLDPHSHPLHMKGRASMAQSVACLSVPKISLNVGGCKGDDNYTMCGPGFDPTFLLSWPRGFIHMNPIEGSGDQKKNKKSAFNFSSGSAWQLAANVLIDGIIAPRDSRKVLSQCLDISRQKSRLQFTPKEFPVFRF